MLLRWSGHRLGTWLVKEQRVSLGSAWGGGIIQLLKQTDPSFLKCLFSPHAFCIVEIVVGPRRGCVVQRVHECRDVRWVNRSVSDRRPLSL